MMYSRLVTFGCSLTYGYKLKNREKHCWPAQLGTKLDIPVINNAKPGISAKMIWWDLINFEFNKKDLVVIGWTHIDRWAIIRNKDGTDIDNIQNSHNTVIARKFYDLHQEYDNILNYFTVVNHANYYLKEQGLKVIHVSMSGWQDDSPAFDKVEWFPINFRSIREKYPKATDDSHPGEMAYSVLANKIYDAL